MTTVYESGKIVTTDLPAQPSRPSPLIIPKGNQQNRSTQLNEKFDIESFSMFAQVGDDEPGFDGFNGPPLTNVSIHYQIARDRNTRVIYEILAFYPYIENSTVYYTASNGQPAYRTISIIGLSGWGAPLPGLPVLVEWSYTVNCVYTWADGNRFTRQFYRTGMKLQF